jgi:hypothetical protein
MLHRPRMPSDTVLLTLFADLATGCGVQIGILAGITAANTVPLRCRDGCGCRCSNELQAGGVSHGRRTAAGGMLPERRRQLPAA